jgi:hypothetical protein
VKTLIETPRRLADRWSWPMSEPVPVLTKPERVLPATPADTNLDELRALLAAIPNEGEKALDYDQWRNVIFALHHATGGSDEGLALAHEFSARSSKYEPAFLDERVWPYINPDTENPITIASLRREARIHEDPADDFEDLGPLSLSYLEGKQVEVLADGLPDRFRVLDEATVLQRPRPRWLVKGVVPEAELVVIYGASTTGKSFVALDIFACVARGVPWRGIKTKQADVIYLAAEGQGGFRNRLEAYQEHHKTTTGLRMVLDAPNFLKADADLVGKQIQAAGGAGVIIIDTLAQVSPGGDENSAEDMGKVLLSCRRLRKLTGAMIVLIHHAGKDLTKGSRGWSGLKAAADAEIEISRLEAQRWIRVSKSKDGEDGAEYPFRLLPVVLGLDEDGDEITSCVIEHTQQVARGQIAEPKGKVERVVWRLAHEIAELGDGTMPVDMLITEGAKKLLYDPQTGRDRRREFAKKAIATLCDSGFLIADEGTVTVPGVEE